MAYNEPLQSQQVDNLGNVNGEVLERTAGAWAGGNPVSIVGNVAPPQGRLTLQTGKPVMTADATAQTTIYYDTYQGNQVPIFNGTSWAYFAIAGDEISMGLDAGVPHVTSGKLYDIFGLNSAAALVIGIGPAWSSSTARGIGAGTTQLALVGGIWTNAVSLTHCWGGASGTTDYGAVAANTGTYLGTFLATANGQTGMQFNPAPTGGGNNSIMGLYNGYNRVSATSISQDNTASWTINSTAWRAANNNANNSVRFVDGLQQSPLIGRYAATSLNAASTDGTIGVALDSVSGAPGGITAMVGGGSIITTTAMTPFRPQLGLHLIRAAEVNNGGGNTTFFGASTDAQGGVTMMLSLEMSN